MSATDPHYTEDRREGASLPRLLGGLINDVSTLFRQEIELAKTEAGERVQSAVNGGVMIAIGAVLALGALGVLLAAIVVLIGAWLETTGLDPLMANSIAAFGVAIVVGLIAWIMISNGIGRLKATNFQLPRTASTLQADAEAVKERF